MLAAPPRTPLGVIAGLAREGWVAQLQGPPPRGVPHHVFVRRKRAERRTDRGPTLLIGGVVAAVTIRRHGRPDADGRSIPAARLVITAAVVGVVLALVLLIVRLAARRS